MSADINVIRVPSNLNTVREFTWGTDRFRSSLGALDFPTAFVVSLDVVSKLCSIDVAYAIPPEEQSRESKFSAGSTITVGVQSGRVLRITMELPDDFFHKNPNVASFKISFDLPRSGLKKLREEAQKLPARLRPPRRAAHYDAMTGLLSAFGPQFQQKLERLRAAQR